MLHLMTRTGAQLPPGYEQSSVGVLALMLAEVKQEFERAAARRVEENVALRGLFAEAARVVTDAALRARLEEAARGRDESLRVSDLEASNAALRALLIELHAHVEETDSAGARRIEDAIWRELVASTERRRIGIGAF
jgi:hypothetical protein